jgi:hypothetical protein
MIYSARAEELLDEYMMANVRYRDARGLGKVLRPTSDARGMTATSHRSRSHPTAIYR